MAENATQAVDNKQHFTKKELNQLWYRWACGWFSSSSYEKLESHAFAWSYCKIADKYYADDPDGRARLLTRHSQFYNTEPQIGTVINGIVASLEEDIAFGGDTSEELPGIVKTTLMGPLAGLGDSVIQGIIVPTLLSIGMGMSSSGSPVGAIFYIITWLIIGLAMSYGMFWYGYKMGINAIDLFIGEESRRLINSINILGIIIAGVLAASNVSVTTILNIPNGDEMVALSDTLDSMFPGLLGLITTLFTWWMVSKKGITATKALIVLVVIAIVLCAVGFL